MIYQLLIEKEMEKESGRKRQKGDEEKEKQEYSNFIQ